MPARLRHRLDRVGFATVGESIRVDPAVLQAVSEAVQTQSILRFDYGDAVMRREAEPHGIVARDGRWYLVAWDLERQDWRIFRLDRLVPRTPTGPAFTPRPIPTGNIATFVAARFKGAHDQDRWPCHGQVEISLPAHELQPWVRDGQIEAVSEQVSLVTLGSWSWTGLITAILQLDAPFRIVGPEALIHAAETIARRVDESRAG
jgi:hypothetical protein